MSEIAAYLHQLDQARSHAFESIDSALDGVGEDEAFWQAPCYAAEEREEGWPPPGSVAWQVAHLAHCKRYYAACFRQAGATERPPVTPWTPCETFAELRAALDAAHSEQRDAIASLGDDGLDLAAGNDMSFREFLAMCVRHDTWHASQIAVARRLHKAGPK